MRKLTKTQTKVLRRLAAGEAFESTRYRTSGWMQHPWLYVHASTVRSLINRGLIRQRGELREWAALRTWIISEKGRRTLEEHDAKIS